MRIFGRKANQQSTTPTAPDVPPELQPYYGRPSLAMRLRRVGLFVLPVIAALALIAALIAGGMWLRHRSDQSSNKVATNQSTSQKPTTNSNQNQGSNSSQSQNQGNNQSQPAAPQPTNTSPNNSSSANNSTSQQPSGNAQQPGTNSSGATPANIPNTGPDAGMYLLALVMASIATVTAYVRQLKTVRR